MVTVTINLGPMQSSFACREIKLYQVVVND